MPNWAEGTLKIRGKRDDIKNFLTNSLTAIDSEYEFLRAVGKDIERERHSVETEIDDWEMFIQAPEGFYIKGTRRAFIENSIQWYFEDRHIETLFIDGFKAAWGVDASEFAEISKSYNLDIKITVYECGMEFSQEIEIHNGKIVRDDEIKYEDYAWDCPYPNLGG